MKIKMRFLRKSLQSGILFLYFILMAVHSLLNHNLVIDYAWKSILLLCFIFGVLGKTIVVSNRMIMFGLGLFISSFANFIFIGNASVFDFIYPVFYLGVYQLLKDDEIYNRMILLSIYINCLILSFIMLRTGIGQAIFIGYSNNFLSVILLAPTIVYYARMEYYQEKISLCPIVAVSSTCLLALGRGGILASASLLFFMVFYLLFSNKNWNNRREQKIFRVVIFVLVFLIVGWLLYSPYVLQSTEVLKKFNQYGMYGTGRIAIWDEYLTAMVQKPESMLFGTSFSELPLMLHFNNNLHNSFLNIHAYYGLFAFLYVIYMFLSNCKFCIKEMRWIYFFLLTVFFMRAFTDKIFGGGSVATPILFFLFWYIKDKRWVEDHYDCYK